MNREKSDTATSARWSTECRGQSRADGTGVLVVSHAKPFVAAQYLSSYENMR